MLRRFSAWEIRNNPRFARTNRALQGDDPGAMLDTLVRNYEVPADPGRAIAERQRFYEGFKPGEAGAAAKGGQFDGLRVKGAQATAGGSTAEGVTDLARAIQHDIPSVKHFSSFNDLYHKGTGSKHASGLAFDTLITDPSKSTEMAAAIRSKLEAADAYHRSASELAAKAKPRATPEDLAKGASTGPKPVRVMGTEAGDAGSVGWTTVHAPVTIHAGNQSPADIANGLQRHVSEARGFRSHDLEPELT